MRAACQALLTDQTEERVKLLLAKRKPTVVFTLWDVLRKCGNTVGYQCFSILYSLRISEQFGNHNVEYSGFRFRLAVKTRTVGEYKS